MTFWETIERGEYVMFALAVLLLISIIIFWVRAVSLNKQRKSYPSLMQRIRDYVVEGDVDNARQMCGVINTAGARVLDAGLGSIGEQMSEVKTSMDGVAAIEKEGMNKGLLWLKAFALISPLLGLGGTLVGITDRLRDIGDSENPVNSNAICLALAPTIVTTVAGLVVGVLIIIVISCLESIIISSKRNLDNLKIEFTDLLNEPS